MKAQRMSRGIAQLLLEPQCSRGREVITMPRPLYPWERDMVPNVQEAGQAPGPVWTGVENLSLPGLDPHTVLPVASHYTDYVILTYTLRHILS